MSALSLVELTYYVSISGNDNNPGTFSQPWRTINKAARTVIAGDTVYIRAGTYNEWVDFSRSGTSNSPISFLAYPNENPVVDGNNYTIPSIEYGPLLKLSGEYITISGLEVRYSRGMGIAVNGKHNILDKIYAHHNKQNGIYVSGDNSLVQNCRISSNSMVNLNGSSTSGWATGISASRSPNYAIIRKNEIYGNWGEGLSTYEANGTIIEDNIVHDNWSANIYISDATNILLQRNFVFASGTMTIGSRVGIMMGDEKYTPPSSNITIVNNIAYGNHGNFWWWQGFDGGGMSNVLIANNTFVNGTGSFSGGEGGVIIGRGDHSNVYFYNNLVQQDGDLPVISTIPQAGITYSHNLWSKQPYSAAIGPGDVIGDPALKKTGSPFSPDWFMLTNISPAIDKAMQLAETNVDFFSDIRGQIPDIGADEELPLVLTPRIYLPMVLH